MNVNPKKYVFLHTCDERIIYKNVYIWGVNFFTSRVKNDEFRLGRMNSEFVSIKPRRNMRELYIKNGCYGSQVIMTKKDICIISKENDRQEVGDMKKIIDVYK